MSVSFGVTKPYGPNEAGNDGTETSLGFLVTKSLGTVDVQGGSPYSYVPRQTHLNAIWYHNTNPLPQERDDRYLFGLGYSQPLSSDLVLTTDIYRETQRMRRNTSNMVEVGARYLLTPQTVLSGAIGGGFGGQRTENYSVTIGLQHALSVPF